MAKSATFSVVKASTHSSAHNSREDTPEYLIGTKEGAENVYDLRHSDSQFLVLAQAKYKETTGQKMQQKQIDALIKETVLSLEDHHTEADVQKVFDQLNEKYGGHYITELSIHRDEGHFEDKNGVTYYPTKDILQKEDGWYIVPLDQSLEMKPSYKPKEHEFSEKVDISQFKPVHNVHAHVKFSMFDLETGRTGRMKHNELNDRIKTAARVLKLEYNPEKGSKGRVAVEQIKTQHKAVRNEKIKALEKGLKSEQSLGEKYDSLPIKERLEMRSEMRELLGENTELKSLKEELKALKEAQKLERSELQSQGATRADYAIMEAKYKAIELELKALKETKTEIPHEPINARLIGELKSEVEMLQISNRVLENELKETKSAPVPKGENVASKQIERYVEEMPKSATVQPKTDELELRRFENGAEAKEAKYRYGDEYAKRILEKHTNIVGKVDKEALIKELGTEFKETATVLNRGLVLVNDFKSAYERTKSGLNSTLKSAKTALEDVYSKIVGKSLPQVQNERTEQERAIKQEQIKQAEAQRAKEPEQERSPSRGLSLGR